MTKEDISKSILKDMTPYSADILNPFAHTIQLSPLQVLKSVLLTLLMAARLVLMFLILVVAWVLGVVALKDITKKQALGLEPISGWRRNWMKPLIVKLARFMFFVGGWYWIPQKGRRATAKEAPILLVMPHSSFFDTVLVIALGCPSMVVKDSTEHAPLFGSLVKYTQPFFVKSGDPNSRHRIAEQILERVTSGKDFEQLLIFPEGGCGNRKALLQFKLGGFTPGVPVQPVFIRYKNKLDTVTWTWEGPGTWKQLWLTMTQFCIKCEIEFLPVYTPSEMERKNPRIFADNVQAYASQWTGTPFTRFSLEDARFFDVAREQRLPLTAALIKLLRLRKTLGCHSMSPLDELDRLEKKRSESFRLRGDVNHMAKYLNLEYCPKALKDFYHLMDQHSTNSIDIRMYDVGVCLIRDDIKVEEKLKIAFKILGMEDKDHFETLMLYLKGAPANLNLMKTSETISTESIKNSNKYKTNSSINLS